MAEERLKIGDIVKHFKREYVEGDSPEYLYEILEFGYDSETMEPNVVYRALYPPYKVCVRPYDMFMSEVDRTKYPDAKQQYRFELVVAGPERIGWWEDKKSLVKAFTAQNLTVKKGQVLFVGSSLMEMFPIDKFTAEDKEAPLCYNRGVGGYKTSDMLAKLDEMVFGLEPSRIFINIGTNDLSDPSISMDALIAAYREILERILERLPGVDITLMAYYPINYEAAADYMKPVLKIRTNEKIAQANRRVEELAGQLGLKFINVNAPLMDDQGRLKAEYTLEGMHINEEGYRAIYPLVRKHLI